MTDQITDAEQPEPGQDGGGSSETPYAEYLNRIPEEVRGEVEPVFKEWDANTTRKFQEHATYRQGWEPYEQIGVNQHSPEEVQWALQFRQALDNPDAIKQWYEQEYAPRYGIEITQQQAAQQQQQQEVSTQGFDEFGLYQDPGTQQLLDKQFQERLGPIQKQLEQFSQWQQNQELTARQHEARQMIDGQISELKSKHGDEFNEQAVDSFVAKYIETDPYNAVPRAWADYQQMRNDIEKQVLQSKVNAPPAAEGGGTAAASPEPINTMADANRVALQRLRDNRIA